LATGQSAKFLDIGLAKTREMMDYLRGWHAKWFMEDKLRKK